MKADNKKIWIRGQFVEVTDEVYAAYMKGDRKIRYFENDLKTGRTVKDKDGNIKQTLPSREDSLDRLMEDNAQQFLDSHESVEDIVIQKISAEKLHMALLRFSKLRERYYEWNSSSMEEKNFESFGIVDGNGKLTNAGALLADNCPIRHSRLFCTRWNGLDKSGGRIDALDSAEFTGSLIILLNEGFSFVKRNMKTAWKKTANSRIELPDYCERSVFESIVNALIHRDYLINGSEVHIDIFDDRLVVYSPGGMPDGTKIQERNIDTVPSTRRNPVLADIFSRLGYMERQGSGLNKIRNAYRSAENYTPDKEPVFYSDRVEFTVTLKNLNFSASENEAKSEAKNEAENYRLTELEERLCNLLLEYPELTQSEIRERLDLSRSKVQRMMRKLTEDGIIIREGSRRKGYWTIHL